MKVKDLIEKLEQYNPEARIKAVAHCKDEEFSLAYGGSDGVDKETCTTVSIWIDGLNHRGESSG